MSVKENLIIKKKEKMKKFNGFEKELIVTALHYYVANLEEEIETAAKGGRNPIIAPGFYTMMKKELIEKVELLSKKK
tara:strand:+ start:87 stop:317 length:231 start_codon:yes stop_codon:yes gene_type:complete